MSNEVLALIVAYPVIVFILAVIFSYFWPEKCDDANAFAILFFPISIPSLVAYFIVKSMFHFAEKFSQMLRKKFK